MFKVCQKVVWTSNNSRPYLLGAKAMVTGIDDEYLFVKWLAPCKQCDGGYYPHEFEVVIEIGEQLLFPFMEE